MTRTLRLGFSPCPNDTFMFHDLLHGHAPVAGSDVEVHVAFDFDFDLLDIEALNQHALREPPTFDIVKLSIPALAGAVDDYAVLDSGAALGRGCGPLVVQRSCADSAAVASLASLAGGRVAIPGENTTAYLLFRIFGPPDFTPVPMRFDEIMRSVAAGQTDAGLIIHESRFTFQDHGLACVADLGHLWETDTDLPLPLGIIAARRTLPDKLVTDVESALRRSITDAFADPSRSWSFVRDHSQEMDEDVCRQHIDLYVNEYSQHLGDEGRRAIEALLSRGRSVGHLPDGRSPWRDG